MKITEENYLSKVIHYLSILSQAYQEDNISSMVDDGDAEDRIEEIEALIKYLEKTN